MSGIAIKIDKGGFAKLEAQLVAMGAKVPQAIALGLNEGGDKVRTQVQRALQTQTGLVAYRSVLSRTSTRRAYVGGLSYQIVVRGKPSTRIDEFSFKAVRGKGGFVSAKMWGVDHVFKRSFVTNSGLLRARTQKARMPIRGFDGPNLAKELDQGIVPGRFHVTAGFTIPMAIEKRLARIF